MNKWDKRFFDLCDLVSSWSEDIHTKVGSVIVGKRHEIISIGFNGLPRNVRGTSERYSRDDGEKYHWFEHAERNAIYNSASVGTSCLDATIYCNLFPCVDCTRGIIQSGISTIKTYRLDDFRVCRSYDVAKEMIKEAGVNLEIFER